MQGVQRPSVSKPWLRLPFPTVCFKVRTLSPSVQLCSAESRHSVKVADKWETVHHINCKLQESSSLPRNNKCQGPGAMWAPFSLDLENSHSSKAVPLRACCSSGKIQGGGSGRAGCHFHTLLKGVGDVSEAWKWPREVDNFSPTPSHTRGLCSSTLQVAAFWAEQGGLVLFSRDIISPWAIPVLAASFFYASLVETTSYQLVNRNHDLFLPVGQ